MNQQELTKKDKRSPQAQSEQKNHHTKYYHQLKHYIPICYNGVGIPFFLKNRNNPYQSLPCIIFMNILFIMIITLSMVNSHHSNDKQFIQTLSLISIIVLIFLNISYFLTVLMNPGIIAQEDFDKQSKENLMYCAACGKNRMKEMNHCIQCQVCVQNLDHHCGFFGRCIAGSQRYGFYMFITFVFLGFICILGNSSLLLN